MIVACLWVMLGRIGYGYDLEWMTGAELDHIERIQRGLPIYTAPTSNWIPFLYPPFYYYAAAFVARLVSDLRLAARIVSVAATFAQIYFIWRISRRQDASKYWSYLAIGAFCAAFPFVEYWYDVERADSLFTAALLLALVILTENDGLWSGALGGVTLGLAFFVKQPALLFAGAMFVGLLVRGQARRALALALGSVVPMVVGIRYFNAHTEGWFSFYVLDMPRAHGISLSLLPQLITDLSRAWLYTAATVIVFVLFLWRFKGEGRKRALPVAFLAASFAASSASRLHVGGWTNVLMFWTASASIAVGVIGAAIERSWKSPAVTNNGLECWIATLLPLLVTLQFWQFGYAPWAHIPSHSDCNFQDEFTQRIRQLETKGEVLTLGVGHLTATRHFHDAALFDVLYVQKRVPDAIVADVRAPRFAAIVIDNFDDLWLPYEPAVGDFFFRVVAAHYYIAERLDERLPPCVLGFQVRPSWVLLPRSKPLDESQPLENLIRLQQSEVAVAQAREQAERRGIRFSNPSNATEVLGERLMQSVYADERDSGLR